MIWFYGISAILGYLMTNPLYTFILNIRFGLGGVNGISTIVGYLMPNHYTSELQTMATELSSDLTSKISTFLVIY